MNAGGFENNFRAWGGNSAPAAVAGLALLLGPCFDADAALNDHVNARPEAWS